MIRSSRGAIAACAASLLMLLVVVLSAPAASAQAEFDTDPDEDVRSVEEASLLEPPQSLESPGASESAEPPGSAEASAAAEVPAPTDLAAPPEIDPRLPVPIRVLGELVQPGTLARLMLRSSESFSGTRVETHVAIVHGRAPGPRVCIVAGIHGDEVNGVEVVRRALTVLSPITLKGTVLAVPIANPSAFRRGSRYLPDRRDLNRFFPGSLDGSSASRIAESLFSSAILGCDALVDLHTGSFHRANLHQLRADLADVKTAQLAAAFGAIVVNSAGRIGTLRRAATDAGIPAITVEAGESARFNKAHVEEALQGILRLLEAKGMIAAGTSVKPQSSPVAYLRTKWVRCDQGGILVSRVSLGQEVRAGETLGTISDPLSEEVETVKSPISGRIIGMALDQVVMPGFAAFHLGFEPRPLTSSPGQRNAAPRVAPREEAVEGLDPEERPE
ncbi:MAG: succinylglutamate desuccinylase/aspartoacylase family protein [Myxococcota bacterium]